MNRSNIVRRVWKAGTAMLLGAALAGCVGYAGPDGVVYGDTWGPDVYVFGGGRFGHDHDFARRGFASRRAAGFHAASHGFAGGRHR